MPYLLTSNKKFTMHDLIIVGAGPAGLYTAKLCSESGIKTLVLEEHDEIGNPDHCSGLISTNIEKFVKIDESWVENRVKGAVVHFMNNRLELKKDNVAAYVINRTKFDKSLSKDLKARILTGSRVTGINFSEGCAEVKTQKGSYKCRMIAGCDGTNSVVARNLGSSPKERLNGIIAITGEKNSGDFVELWFDKKLAGDGFIWKIPRGKTTEYGMMSSGARFKTLESFFNLKPGYDRKASVIPIGPTKTFFKRALLIGDAAAQVKPWSGGGVVYSLTCARIAADVIKESFGKNDFSEAALERYEKEWVAKVGKNITAGLMFRELYKESDEKELDYMFRSAQKISGINKLDMDFPLLNFL